MPLFLEIALGVCLGLWIYNNPKEVEKLLSPILSPLLVVAAISVPILIVIGIGAFIYSKWESILSGPLFYIACATPSFVALLILTLFQEKIHTKVISGNEKYFKFAKAMDFFIRLLKGLGLGIIAALLLLFPIMFGLESLKFPKEVEHKIFLWGILPIILLLPIFSLRYFMKGIIKADISYYQNLYNEMRKDKKV